MCANQTLVNANGCGCVNRVAIKTTTDAGHGDRMYLRCMIRLLTIVIFSLFWVQCDGKKYIELQPKENAVTAGLSTKTMGATEHLIEEDTRVIEASYVATTTLRFEEGEMYDKPPMGTVKTSRQQGEITKNIASVFFEISPMYTDHDPQWSVSVVKAADGAFVEYVRKKLGPNGYYKSQTAELDLREWQDFVNMLYTSRIDEWEMYNDPLKPSKRYVGDAIWTFDIFFSDKERFRSEGWYDPPNANQFMKIVNDMKAKTNIKTANISNAAVKDTAIIEKKMATELELLEAEYKKRFGRPISSIERSIVCVSFLTSGTISTSTTKDISVTKAANGAFAEHIEYRLTMALENNVYKSNSVKLGLGEWLDFINAMYACNIDKWGNNDSSIPKDGEGYSIDDLLPLGGTMWELTIFFSDKGKLQSSGKLNSRHNPPDFERFAGIMDGIKSRIEN